MNPILDRNDDFILRDEQAFFEVVNTTPDDVEAVDLLRRAKRRVTERKNDLNADGETSEDQSLGLLQTKLNEEIAYREDRRNRYRLWNAIKALWGQEGADRVKSWIESERSAP